jgi:hypothetical protein
VRHLTCSALAQMVTGSNFDMAIAVLANVIRAGPAFSRQLSGRSYDSKKWRCLSRCYTLDFLRNAEEDAQ